MKNTGVIAIMICLLAMLTSSCELDDNLDMDLPERVPIPLVEAYLVEGEPLQILVYRSNTLQEAGADESDMECFCLYYRRQ